MAKQMTVPDGVSGTWLSIDHIPSGVFIAVPKERVRLLFCVLSRGEVQGFFPVLHDGTVSSSGDFSPNSPNGEVEVLLARQIPALRTDGNKIVWSNERVG